MIRDGRRLHFAARKPLPGSRRHFFSGIVDTAATSLGVGADTAATIGQVVGPALTGAGIGALAGGGKGALIGGGAGALLGGANAATGGNWFGLAGTPTGDPNANVKAPAGTDPSLIDNNGNLILPPSLPTVNSAGNLVDSSGNVITGSDGNPIPASSVSPVNPTGSNAAPGSGGASPMVQQAQSQAGKGGGLFGGQGANATSLLLGLASALSARQRPQVGNYNITPQTYQGLPGPSQVSASYPTLTQPLNTSPVPGRQAVTPNVPNWLTYGQLPEQQFFANNSLASYGFAEGGSLDHEFSTANGQHRVRGPGTGTSDDVPARLSNGEYVLTAADVERIGGGSNDRGARILDHDRGALARVLGERKFIRQRLKKPVRDVA